MIKKEETIKTVGRNSLWLMIDRLIRMGLNVLVGILIARQLGPNEYGHLAYSIAYISIFLSMANLGLEGIVVRELVDAKVDKGKIIGTTFGLRLIFGVFAWIIAMVVIALNKGCGDRTIILIALSGAILVSQSFDTVELWFQSCSQNDRILKAKIFSYVLANSLRIYFLSAGYSLEIITSVVLLEAIISAIGLLRGYKKYPCEDAWKFDYKIGKFLLAKSWPLILSGMATMTYMRIDQIMIKEYLGSEQMGIYTALLPLATLWQIIPMILNSAVAPLIAKKKNEGEVFYWNAISRLFMVYGIIGWGSVIVTLIASNYMVPFLFGPEYLQGISALNVYSFTNLFICLGIGQGLWMINEGRLKIAFITTFLGAIISFFGNSLLLDKFGIIGAAYTAVFAMACTAFLSNIIISRRIFLLQLNAVFLGIIPSKVGK